MKIIKALILLVLTVTLITSLSGCGNKDSLSAKNKKKIENVKLPLTKDNHLDLDIYFDASVKEGEAKTKVDSVIIDKEQLIGQVIVNQLIKGPSIESKLSSILPKEVRLINFDIQNDIAIINFSKEALVEMTATKEESCLSSIVLSVTQLPSVNRVKILVEGKTVQTLGGNYNIEKPFMPQDISGLKIDKQPNS